MASVVAKTGGVITGIQGQQLQINGEEMTVALNKLDSGDRKRVRLTIRVPGKEEEVNTPEDNVRVNRFVFFVGCRNLSNKEWFSRQDPYVIVEYANSKFRTRTHTDGGKNPMFSEKFTIPLIEGLREINVEVWNSNTVSMDDFIGSAIVLLERALTTGYDDSAWVLKSKHGKTAGEVNLIIHYANAKANKEEKVHGAPGYPGGYPPASGGYPPSGHPVASHAASPAGYPSAHGAPMGYPPSAAPAPYPAAYAPPPSQSYHASPSGYPPAGGYPPPPSAYPPAPSHGAPYPAPSGYPPVSGYPPSGYPPPQTHGAPYPAPYPAPPAHAYPVAPHSGYGAYPGGHGGGKGHSAGKVHVGSSGHYKHGKHKKYKGSKFFGRKFKGGKSKKGWKGGWKGKK